MTSPKYVPSPPIRDVVWNSDISKRIRGWLSGRNNIDLSHVTEKNAVHEAILRMLDDDSIMLIAKHIQAERKSKKEAEVKA